MVNAHEQKHWIVQDDHPNESLLNMTLERRELQQHLKKLRQIKKDLRKHKTGTPLRKRDRIDVNNS